MFWIVATFVLLAVVFVLAFLLKRATTRLLQFDDLFQSIVVPMAEYGSILGKISNAEGVLHDHPEVMAFHRANSTMLDHIERSVNAIARPREPRKQLPRPEAV